jgi:hypothetical protein
MPDRSEFTENERQMEILGENLRAKALRVTDVDLVVELEDGSTHSAPIALFPILADATQAERAHWEPVGRGTGFCWPALDEHISVFSIVHPERTVGIRPEAAMAHIREARRKRAPNDRPWESLSPEERDALRRERESFLSRLNPSFARLRKNRPLWEEELAERALWDGSLGETE